MHSSRGYEGRRHGALAVSLASIVIRTSPAPPLLNARPAANDAETLSDAEVTERLQDLMRTGITNLRSSLPNILGYIKPPTPAPAPSPFQHTCRVWTESIRAALASLVVGSSRLASPPPCSFAWPDAPSSWEDNDVAGAGAARATPLFTAPVPLMASPAAQVPNSWDDEEGDAAWFDADGEAAELADAVALAPLRSPSPVATPCVSARPDITSAMVQEDGIKKLEDITSVEDLFDRPPVPILPTPATHTMTTGLAMTSAGAQLPLQRPAPPEERRSVRLAAKPAMSAMDKAIKVLHGKMGIDEPELPLELARRLYVDKYKKAVPEGAIQALTTLFRLNIPSVTAADEALIAMAGPGGSDLAPGATLESFA